MRKYRLTAQDEALVTAAKTFIQQHFKEDWHHIGVAVRSTQGHIFTAFNLDTYVGGRAICAEPIAVGKALSSGQRGIETLVAVRHPRPSKPNQKLQVVSPCGGCRELITDYAPDAFVILEENGELFKVKAAMLLPQKYKVGKRSAPAT